MATAETANVTQFLSSGKKHPENKNCFVDIADFTKDPPVSRWNCLLLPVTCPPVPALNLTLQPPTEGGWRERVREEEITKSVCPPPPPYHPFSSPKGWDVNSSFF